MTTKNKSTLDCLNAVEAVVSTGGAAAVPFDGFPAVGTEAWGRMNQERAALIRKKTRGELTPAERERYEYLQSRSLAALDAAFPHHVLTTHPTETDQ